MTYLPQADARASLQLARGELQAAFESVLDGGRYILAEQVEAFEQEWADYCGVAHVVGCSSGTDALALALRAVGVGPGDEVLVPAMTAIATWMAVAQIGAHPVGVDIEPSRNGMDPELARGALGSRVRAIVAVHLFGQPADVDALARVAREAGVPLVEDAAQAHGARVRGRVAGSLGTIAAFSFYPTKNLGAIGDAGAVTTDDGELAERVMMLRQYGWRTRAEAEIQGVNARLDELQAAFLRVMLRRLEATTAQREATARAYLDSLTGVPELELPARIEETEPVWHQFVVRHPDRDLLARELETAGIGTGVHYAPPPPFSRAFGGSPGPAGGFPVAQRHAATALSLPMHAGVGEDERARVAAALRAAVARG